MPVALDELGPVWLLVRVALLEPVPVALDEPVPVPLGVVLPDALPVVLPDGLRSDAMLRPRYDRRATTASGVSLPLA